MSPQEQLSGMTRRTFLIAAVTMVAFSKRSKSGCLEALQDFGQPHKVIVLRDGQVPLRGEKGIIFTAKQVTKSQVKQSCLA